MGQEAPTAAGLATLESIGDSAVQGALKNFPTAPGADETLPVTVPGTSCAAGCAIPFGSISPIAPNFYNQKDFIINGDYTQGKHQLSFHVLYDRQRSPNPNFDTPEPQFTGDVAVDARKYLFKDTWIISNRLVNDFRASYSRFLLDYGVPPISRTSRILSWTTAAWISDHRAAPRRATSLTRMKLAIPLATCVGIHLQVGWVVHQVDRAERFPPRARGEWDYTNLNEFVNDYVPTGLNGALRGAGSGLFSGNEYGIALFVQDDWKVTPRLTLNLGLRYEWESVPYGESLESLNSISNLPGPIPQLYPGGPSSIIFGTPKSDTNNFGPRLGFAYDPFGDGKWAVRGGFGISYDVTPQNFPSISLPPQLQTEQNPVLTCSLPVARLVRGFLGWHG